MTTPLEQRGYVKLLEALNRPNVQPPLDHYPPSINQHCYGCRLPTDQTFVGINGINPRRPSHTERIRKVGFMCDHCKYMNDYKYCSPDEEMSFKTVRGEQFE